MLNFVNNGIAWGFFRPLLTKIVISIRRISLLTICIELLFSQRYKQYLIELTEKIYEEIYAQNHKIK